MQYGQKCLSASSFFVKGVDRAGNRAFFQSKLNSATVKAFGKPILKFQTQNKTQISMIFGKNPF